MTDNYIIVQDIEGRNSGDFGWNQGAAIVMISGDYIKMIRVGATECYQQPVDFTTNEMSNPFSLSSASYVLLEECYSWGWGKYVFLIYTSDHIVLRRCIARQDGWARGYGSCFQAYSSSYVEYQNCIGIDYDEPRHWHPQISDGLWGGFCENGTTNNTTYRGCIVKNVKGPDVTGMKDSDGNPVTSDYNMAFFCATSTSSYINCVVIDCITGIVTRGQTMIQNCSFITMPSDSHTVWDGRGVMKESGILLLLRIHYFIMQRIMEPVVFLLALITMHIMETQRIMAAAAQQDQMI